MSETAHLPEPFDSITDIDEIDRFLKEGVKTLSAVLFWTHHQELSVSSYLNHFHDQDRTFCIWKPKDFDPKDFQQSLGGSSAQECYFNLALMSSSLFFRTDFLGLKKDELNFKAPKKIFKVQRRSYFRLPLAALGEIRVRFQDPFFPESSVVKKILDLSAGGLSFLASDQEEALFYPGMELKKMTFTIQGREMTCDAEVRHFKVMPVKSDFPGVKVGVRFLNLNSSDSQLIASYVFEESRKYLSRYL